MEKSKVVDVPEWEHFLIYCNVMYTTAWPPVVYTDLDEQNLIELFLIADDDDGAGHVASPTKQAYVI